jgi:hypothetical protein
MRNIEASPWLTNPELVEIKLVPAPGAKDPNAPKVSEFTLTLQVKRTPAPTAPIPGTPGPGAPAKSAGGAKA